eukprot:gnl/TRDRNA2_/TRDRNA2_139412_c1_seq1.p1 gnl/TRDRNA2_/TRDRNA2_139412_c1~~gnl/TRDRNA2_/TRDRNA2_139412_c1_seq1.p1  ORF type:complete len:139 (-),score=13.01 gnl/TRDRNA2_/TRDRNA2_139412_c1_seq1:171-545(-)
MVGDRMPSPRILGGGCALPDGTLLLYGGWNPALGTYGDMWAAHVEGYITPFCRDFVQPIEGSSTLQGGFFSTLRLAWCRFSEAIITLPPPTLLAMALALLASRELISIIRSAVLTRGESATVAS